MCLGLSLSIHADLTRIKLLLPNIWRIQRLTDLVDLPSMLHHAVAASHKEILFFSNRNLDATACGLSDVHLHVICCVLAASRLFRWGSLWRLRVRQAWTQSELWSALQQISCFSWELHSRTDGVLPNFPSPQLCGGSAGIRRIQADGLIHWRSWPLI